MAIWSQALAVFLFANLRRHHLIALESIPTDMSTKPATKPATKKPTLTLAKPAAKRGDEATSPSTGRSHSTRAKQAARRDGRELPIVRGKVKDPLIAATPTESSAAKDYRSKSQNSLRSPGKFGERVDGRPVAGKPIDGKPAAGRPVAGKPIAGKPIAGKPVGGHERTEHGGGGRSGAAPRGAESPRAFVPRPAGRRSTGMGGDGTSGAAPRGDRAQVARIDGRTGRYDGKRDNRPVAKTIPAPASAPPATPAREPDGMIRVSKLLSEQGLCSRREADSYIARGWVWADGERVTELGTRVLPTAKLTLDQHAAMMQDQRVTILLNKPIGYVSGQAEDGYQPASVLITAETQLETDTERFQHINRRGLAPAGRLDIDSAGLLVLTQDGRIAKQLVGENSPVEKEYLVRVEGKLAPGDLERLRHGLELDGEALKPAKVKWQNADQLNFILQEGKKRQIRRMCEMVGLKVVGLKRIRIGHVLLGDLPPGKWRFLRGNESFL
jgi:23S rRNA pseudouridine2604 synthase